MLMKTVFTRSAQFALVLESQLARARQTGTIFQKWAHSNENYSEMVFDTSTWGEIVSSFFCP